jgi:hypothetical protein
MNPSHDHEKLENLIGQVLHEQPLRRAPRTLEARVFAALERRAAVPWWHKSFMHWPVAARVAFLIASVGFVQIALKAAAWIVAGVDSAPVVAGIQSEAGWIAVLMAAADSVARSVPQEWIWGAIAVIAVMYLALFGLGAAAYKALYVRR